jgi:hypothetical protein
VVRGVGWRSLRNHRRSRCGVTESAFLRYARRWARNRARLTVTVPTACPPWPSLKSNSPRTEYPGMGQDVATGTKPCAYCGELIRAEARKCRFCGEWFDDGASLAAPVRAARPPRAKTSGLAVASFLFALLGGGLGAIPALVLGDRARQQIRESNGSMSGEGWAIAGLVLGLLQLAFFAIIVLVWGLHDL